MLSSEAVRETLLRASFDSWRGGMRIMMEKHKQGTTSNQETRQPWCCSWVLESGSSGAERTTRDAATAIHFDKNNDFFGWRLSSRAALATSQSSWCCPFPCSVLFCTKAELCPLVRRRRRRRRIALLKAGRLWTKSENLSARFSFM